MKAANSSETIKKVQDFMDRLDENVLNRKVLKNVKVKHVAAAFLAYNALQGIGQVENAETTGQIYAGGVEAIGSMIGGAAMGREKYVGGNENSERSGLNMLTVAATRFMVSQVENGEKLYDEKGTYKGTVVNRYDREGNVVESVPVYQVKEGIKNKTQRLSQQVKNAFMQAKKQNG